jgi:hypothetical protein
MGQQWELTVTCPRPSDRHRPGDDFFTRPDRIAKTAAMFFAAGTEITLTARTVRLHRTSPHPPGDIARLHKSLAIALDCLRFNTCTDRARDRYELPRPIRTEIRETDTCTVPAAPAAPGEADRG